MADNNGLKTFTDAAVPRTFVGGTPRTTKPVTVASGQVLKAYTFLESNAATGKVVAHSGMVEKARVVFQAIDAAETISIGGLTFTAGASGCSAADLTTAWAGLTAGITAANANAQNPVAGGTFTAGTLAGWNTWLSSTANAIYATSTTVGAGVTDLAVTGTGDAPTVTVIALNSPLNRVAGLLAFDIDASGGDIKTVAYDKATLFDEALVWANNPAVDTITLADLTTKVVTDYYTGATTDELKQRFLENSGINVLIPTTGEL